MKYVYILRSLANSNQTYIGFTSDLRRRLRDHNSGQTAYTDQFRPWKIETYLAFSDERKAKDFERYLKHGSGHTFLKKHL